MVVVRNFVQNILIVSVMAAFVQLMLPRGNIRRYAELSLGLVMVLTLLSPLVALTRFPWDLGELLTQAQAETVWAEVEAGSRLLKDHNVSEQLALYRKLLEEQLEEIVAASELELVQGQIHLVEDSEAKDFGRITGMELVCSLPQGEVLPVTAIDLSSPPLVPNEAAGSRPGLKEKEAAVAAAIAKYFSLGLTEIKIIIE